MAFAETCLLTAGATAKLLLVDEKSLRALADEGVFRSVRRGAGRTPAFTEGDIRAYLAESTASCRLPNSQKPVLAVRLAAQRSPI